MCAPLDAEFCLYSKGIEGSNSICKSSHTLGLEAILGESPVSYVAIGAVPFLVALLSPLTMILLSGSIHLNWMAVTRLYWIGAEACPQ